MFAGASKIDITPHGSVWMDGMIREHQSEGVHDPLMARALYIAAEDDPKTAFVVVSVEVCTLAECDALAVRCSAAAETGVPAEHIILAATHTHSGPATLGFFNPAEREYIQELSEKLITVISQATSNARLAAAGSASGREETISNYRRFLASDGHVVMNWETYDPATIVRVLGEPDPEVGVLKVVDAENPNEIICLLFNHAGHPNVMSGENYLISSDYPGFAARLLEEEFGCVSMFVNGAQGSVDIDGLKHRDWDGVERAGTALADAVSEIARAITPSSQSTIRGLQMTYELPARQIPDEELAWAEQIVAQTGGAIQSVADGVGDDYKANLVKELRKKQNTPIRVVEICFAVDDTAFVSFPGEMFTEIGQRIRKESPFGRTYVLGLSNGYMGYVPTREAVAQGGYEPETRCCDTCAEEVIVGYTLPLLRNVQQVARDS